MAQSRSKNSSSNKVAKFLRDRRYRQIVIKNKKAYNRKKHEDEFTMLVGLTKEIYRCMNCGADLQQHINGKITYLPHITRPEHMDVFVKEWSE